MNFTDSMMPNVIGCHPRELLFPSRPGGRALEGAFVVVPGSHTSRFEIDITRVDLPGQHVFDSVHAGDVIVFNEALLHNGRPNPSEKARITLIINFGRADAGSWPGYTPKSATLTAVTPRQRQILAPGSPVWQESVLA
jgi:ectoine hydroxylase-related dioxygenase (phytanoyl-CoA dioxygenase family)